MTKTVNPFTVRRPGSIRALVASACVLALAAPLPATAKTAPTSAAPAAPTFETALLQPANAELRAFYYYRDNRPLWLANGELTAPAREVARLVNSSELDGLSPDQVHAAELDAALAKLDADRSPAAADAAELALSRSFAAYVRLTREAPQVGMLFEHVSLQPQSPSAALALQEAAKAPSLAGYVRDMAWLHPLYAPMRRAFAAEANNDPALRRAFRANLARIRDLPAVPPGGRYVLVNTAAQRLWMYDGAKPVDSMKVVVGKVDHPTPMMSGYIRYAILNPYWNVPVDFTRDKIAPRVLAGGPSYLTQRGYEVLSDWSADPTVLDPRTIDWRAVAAGTRELRVRQRPGAANSMGKVKFEFPNQLGIYLHDTPETQLMAKEARMYSSGCIRLQDAQRLGRWLFDGAMPMAGEAESRIDLPSLVPVYVTYLTLQPQDDGGVVVLGDPYGRDVTGEPALAASTGAFRPSR